MTRTSTIALCALLLALPAAQTHARASNGYLSWAGKTPVTAPAAPVQQVRTAEVHTTAGDYAVPPSPYGQVGDPYARALRWPAKQGAQQPQYQPQQVADSQPPRSQPVQTAPVRTQPAQSYMVLPAEQAQPREMTPRAPLQSPTYSPVPQALAPQPPLPQGETHSQDRPDPGADDDAGGINERAPQTRAAETHASQPQSQPQAQDTGDYKVPSSSPYAARIAAARAAQERDRITQVQAQATAQAEAASKAKAEQSAAPAKAAKPTKKTTPVAPNTQATLPVPSLPLAAAEVDHVFVPGQHYTSAADEPRVYSLHRQYGLTPDPITVDPHPTGALLGDPITTIDDASDSTVGDASDTGIDSDTAKAAAAQSSSHTAEH